MRQIRSVSAHRRDRMPVILFQTVSVTQTQRNVYVMKITTVVEEYVPLHQVCSHIITTHNKGAQLLVCSYLCFSFKQLRGCLVHFSLREHDQWKPAKNLQNLVGVFFLYQISLLKRLLALLCFLLYNFSMYDIRSRLLLHTSG